MSTELSNPFSAGGGGGQFEIKVQAAFLALMVLDGPCPCLPRGTIDSVKLQSKHLGYDVDDLLILTTAPNGHHHRLLSQIKHALTFTPSSSEFRDTLLAAWSDFNKQSLFDPARDAIAIVTGPQSARTISHVRPVLEWARHCDSSGEFFAKVDTAQFSAQPKRDFIQTVRNVLSEADHPPSADDVLWGFLKTIHVLSYDFDFAPSQDEARILTMLELARLSDSGPDPRGLWNELIILAGQLNQHAGTLSRERLVEMLSPVLERILPQYRRVSDSASIDRLCEHTERVLGRISTEFAPGVSLERTSLVDEAIDLVEQHQMLIITGDAGSGKSAIARRTIQRLTDDDASPVFAFRMDEFEAPHIHQALVGMGVQDSVAQLSARFSLLSTKILFVDSAERLFELSSTDAFSDLLHTVRLDSTWRIIIGCRTQAAGSLVNHFVAPAGLSVGILQVPKLTDAELDEVAEQVPTLQQFLTDDRIRDVLRTPLYLRILCASAGDLPVDYSKGTALTGIRRLLWHEAVARPRERSGGLPRRRMEAFVGLAIRRARSMRPYVSAEGLDAEAVERLASDNLVVDDGSRLFAPADDLMEDWALFEHIDQCFALASGIWRQFFDAVGSEPALRRAFRIWLSVAVISADKARIQELLINALQAPNVPQYWRDELIVGALSSDSADQFLTHLGRALLDDGKTLLRRCIHLLRTACKGPNNKFIELLGLGGRHIEVFFAISFSQPVGRGWPAIIEFIDQHEAEFGLDDAGLLIGLVGEWSRAIDVNEPLPPEAASCAKIALKYFQLLTRDHVYSRGLEAKFLEVVFSLPHAIPDLIDALFEEHFHQPHDVRSARRRVAVERRTLIAIHAVQSVKSWTMCRFFPKHVMTAIDSIAWRDTTPEPDRYGIDRDQFYGLVDHFELNFFPASAYQGPFLGLLTSRPGDVITYLINFIDRACENYAHSRLGQNVRKVPLRCSEQSRDVYSDFQLWCLYRGSQAGPSILESALMALEEWLLITQENGVDISPWIKLVLDNATTVAPLAVIASVAVANPSAYGELVLPLLSTLEFYQLDLTRATLDQQSVGGMANIFGLPTRPEDQIYDQERKKSAERPHRKGHLEGLALYLQSGPLRERMQAQIDMMSKEDLRTSDDIAARMVLKRIDIRGYEIIERRPDGVVIQPNITEEDLRKASETASANLERMTREGRLHNWAVSTWRGDEISEGIFLTWDKALAEEQQTEDPTGSAAVEEDDYTTAMRLRSGAYVAACVIRDHRAELDPGQILWCCRQIEGALQENADATDMTTQGGRFAVHGSRPSAAVLPLLLDVSGVSVDWVHNMIALALTHAIDEVRNFAIAGVRWWLWDRDPEFASHCLAENFAFAQHTRAVLNGIRKNRGGDFRNSRRELVLEMRASLSVGAKESVDRPAAIQLSEFLDSDLLAAVSLIPRDRRAQDYAELLAAILEAVVAAELREFQDRRGRHNHELSIEFRHAFAPIFAEVLLLSDMPLTGDAPPLTTLISAVMSAPQIAALVLQHLLSSETRHRRDDRFWTIWETCADLVFADQTLRGSDHYIGYSDRRALLHVLLLAHIDWKADSVWEPLNGHDQFFREAITKVGDTPAGFAAVLGPLRTIAKSLLPDALVQLDDARTRLAGHTLLEDENSRVELEWLLRDCVLMVGTQIRAREPQRLAALHLLDYLVDQGSSMAFQLREIIVAPIPVGRILA